MTKIKSNHKFIKAVASGALVVSSVSTIAAPISAAQFSDIENSSHKDSIEQLLKRSIIQGYSDGTFKPNKPVTRGQAAKMIASVLNLDLKSLTNPNYSDIPEDHEFYPYIAALANKGIISGYGDDTFKQGKTITRGQMAKMLAIGFNLTSEKSHPFTDVSNKSEYATYITALFENDITTGTTKTTFSPRTHVTRGQLASFIIRAEKKLAVPSQIEGVITAVTTNAITVNGVDYSLENNEVLATEANRTALLNSTITFEANGTKVETISTINLHKGATSFNGSNIKIENLIVPTSVKELTDVNAENVTVEKDSAVASLKTIAATNTATLTISNSTIETLTVSGLVTVTNNQSSISILEALNSTFLDLHGLFSTVLITAATTIDGNATIETLIGPDIQNANIEMSPTITISNVQIGNKTYTLQQAFQLFGYSILNNKPEDDTNNESEPSEDNSSNEGSKPSKGDSSNDESKKDDDSDKNHTDIPTTPSKPVEVSDGTFVDFTKKEIKIDGETLNLSEEQATTISTFVDNITQLNITSDENGNAVIESITLLARDTFDGTNLTAVNDITILGNVSTISNVQADVLNVEVYSSTLAFENVNAHIIAAGSFNSISGASGDQLTIASTASHVEVSNVTSKNIVIKDSTKASIMASGPMIASIKPMALSRLASNATTTMSLTFSDSNYSGQTLTVERKDTLVDLRSNPFSKITIKNNNVEVKSVSAVDAIVANNITNLRLYANVNTLEMNLESPISIAGGGSTIGSLLMTTTASNTSGWVDLVDVTPTSIQLNGQTVTIAHDIFKKYPAEQFSSSLSLADNSTFGYYSINADYNKTTQSLKYVLLKEDEPINTTSVPTNALDYTGSFIPYADYPKIVVYKVENNTLLGYSLPEAPTAGPITVTNGVDAANKKITFTTRYSDDISPQQAIKYFFVFKASGEPFILSKFNGSWTKVNGLNTYTATVTNANLNGNSLFVANNLVSASGFTISKNPDVYINALKSIATHANTLEPKQPEMIYDILKRIASSSTVPFDSSFLSLYVDAIVNNPSNYNTKEQLEALLTKVQQDNQYDATHIKTATDLYLTGTINTTFTYSNSGIVTNKLSDTGELLTIPKAAGNTTLKVTDSYGNATLVNITVDASKKITKFEIVEAPITGNEVLNGENDFRIFTKGTSKILLPINFKNTVAIIKDGSHFKRYTVALADSLFNLTAEDITPYIAPVQQFGFDDITTVTSTKVGNYELNDGNLLLYPIYAGSETIYVGDANNSTAVHVEVDTDINATIAKSEDPLTIATDLQLQSAKSIELLPANAKVHLYNNGTEIRAFAKDAAKASYTIKDQANNVALVNVTATKDANGKLAVNKFEVVKEKLTLATGVTVQAVSNPIVRVVNDELYALATGTTMVTLSNGEQYEVSIRYTDNQYSMNAEKVTNLLLNAADLQMTNITSIETTSTAVSTHKIANNSQLAVTLNSDTTATLTLISSNNEKAVVHVTKTGTQYDYTVDRVKLTRQQLGLNKLTDATGNAVDIVPARAKVSTDGESVFIYNFEVGNRSFYVTDGTKSTAVNVTVTSNGSKYTTTPEVVKFEIPAHLTIANDASISSNAAHLVGNTLYATGLVKEESTVSVPLANGANYVVKVRFNPESGLYSFDTTGTITYNKSINKATLGLDTISSATQAANSNTEAIVVGDDVLVSIKQDTDTRIQVNGSIASDLSAKAYIYVKRDDTNTTTPVTAEVERTVDAIDLTQYGYNAAPTALWSHAGIARAHIKNNLKVDFYALDLGTTRYELGPADKKLLVNVDVTGANKRTVVATVVEKELNQEGTIIAGDGVRLSANKKTVYATKENVKTIVRLSDNTIVEYNVTIDGDGHYVLNETILPATNTHTITANDLGLSGHITATGLNTDIATQLPFENTITLSAVAAGTTSLIVQDQNNDKTIVNVTVDADKKITVSGPIKVEATDTPTLLHEEDKAIVRIKGKELIAIAEGTAEILVGNTVQQVTVTNANGHYTILDPETISDAVYTASNLGFDTNAAMTIEDGYDREKFYIANVNGKIVAYSKLTGATIGATEFIVKATGTSLRTLVRLNDKGAGLLEQKIAKEAVSLTGTVTVDDTAIARFKDGNLYSFKEGFTHLFENGRMKAIDVTRDSNGDLQATVRPLKVNGTSFTALANTNSSIIEISTEDTAIIYAKGFGETQVQDGNKIYSIKVSKDANNKVTMTQTEVSAKFVPVDEAGLTKFTDVTLVHGTANALSFNRDENNGLTIYNNSGVKSETFAVKVTDGTHDAIINVTVNDAGSITKAEVAKIEITGVKISATETLQTAKARAVWNNEKITVYPLEQGNTAFKFANGLLNAQITKTGNTLVPTAQLLQHEFTSALNTVTNGAIVKSFNDDKSIYPIAEGTALAHTNDKLHTITVMKADDQYSLNVSNGVAFTTIDLATAGGTYAVNDSVLNGVATIVDENTSENKLVIYKEGTGVSDIVITNAANEKSIYHVTATNSEVKTPVLAKTTLTGDMVDAGSLDGTVIRQKDNDLYLLATGNASLKATDNRLINVQVTRDESTKYLTATPTFASTTLKEAPTTLTKYKIDSNTAYAITGVATETFVTTNYRTTLKTVKNGNIYEVTADERQAKQYEFATYGISSTIENVENTVQNVAEAEERNGKLVIYEGTVDGTTTLTVKDTNSNTVKFKVTRSNNGEVFTVTPLVAVESVKFEDIGLDGTTDAITATVFDSSVATVTATSTGLNISAQNKGLTSIELTKNNQVVGIINVKVDADSKVTSTPVKITSADTILYSTMAVEPRISAKGTFINTTGTLLLGATGANKATIIRVTKNADSGYYTVETSEHSLRTINKSELGLSNISSVALTGSSVGTFTKSDGSELYIYGANNGITDVVVTEKVSTTEMKQAIIVANNSSDLVTTIAKDEIDIKDKMDSSDLNSAAWTSNLVEIRDNVIYATKSGTGTATATINGHDVLMNVSVTRNTSSVFVISHDIVAKNFSSTPTVLNGESVIAEGTRIFAQKTGTSTIKIGDQIYTVNVTKSAEGLFTIDVSDPIVQQTYTASQLGLTAISDYSIDVSSGSGVVNAQVLNNNQVIIYAKSAGLAEVTIEGAEGKTIIHALVKDTSNGLTLTPTVAKKTVTNASTLVDITNTFRAYGNELFALKPGHIVTHLGGQLHNLKASLVNNVYDISATRIEKDMGATPTLSTNDTILVAEGNKIVAVDFGETNIIVGPNTYRVKVNNDGTMQTELLVADKINVAEALSTVTGVSASTIATVTHTGTELTIKPKAEGTEIIEVTDGNATVQVEVKVERVSAGEDGLKVTSKLISNSYDVGVIGFYPSGIETAGSQTYRSHQGVLKIEPNGVITLYPGKAGTSHVVITGTAKQAIYDLTVASNYTYTFKPFTTTVTYSEFTAYPTVIDQSGNATAKQGNNGIEVTFVDTNETVFLLKGESGYKTLLVQVEKENGLYKAKKSVVGSPVVVNGDITNVVGNLRTKKDGNNTIIYADLNSTTPASYTANKTLYKATIGMDYALTVNTVTLDATGYSTATHLEENDVVAIVDNKWQAIQEGTGIYRANNDYVQVDVDLTKDAPITVTTLSKLERPTSDITLMDNYNGLYVDGKNIFGSYPIDQQFIAKVDGIIYKGSFKDNLTEVKLNLLNELGWSSYKSHNLTNDNIVKIVNNEIFATGKGSQIIEFTSPTGLKKTLAVTVGDNYDLSTNGDQTNNIINYTPIVFEDENFDYALTVNLNLDLDNIDLSKVSGTRASVYQDKSIVIKKSPGSTAEAVFKINLPELAAASEQTFTITLTSDDNYSITTTNNTIQFDTITTSN